ncbi:hypothetical protein [Geosporobacter ferrireducens]|uniref:Uncharacterized protein n=1 Tax=Geosporobacter ferrireducens TaxID=1424294 RepID=A0A1D8GMQ1_9FIRM|nr:hypothetical protein [Geosporobacter ferrireducens]AOT72221.1 hypothetical protein Gferi_23360 [Geosporobacter ferrireducens]MTI56115.1 hypothetical protein [Geosporobacter ferrireducens]
MQHRKLIAEWANGFIYHPVFGICFLDICLTSSEGGELEMNDRISLNDFAEACGRRSYVSTQLKLLIEKNIIL